MIKVRAAVLPEDAAAIAKIDAHLETAEVYDVFREAGALQLRLVKVDPPHTKAYPLDDYASHAPPCDFALVAVDGERIVGFAATANSGKGRCSLWHFYVDAAYRRQGVGRKLLREIEHHARGAGANHLWVETQNVNVPAIAAYRALGFELCGMDLSLYAGTEEADEVAIYLSRPL